MANNVEAKDSVMEVTRTMLKQTTYEQKRIKVRPFATEPASVRVSLGRTINLGNYEFLRVDVAFEVPCYKEEMLPVYKETLGVVEDKLGEQVEKAMSMIEGEGPPF